MPVGKMTNAEFLENGEWANFYSMAYGQDDYLDFDPPMHDIRFVTNTDRDSLTILNLHGSEEDLIGASRLDSTLVLGIEDIVLKKVYSDGHPARDWACIMTALDIVDSWRRSNYSV